MKYDEIWGVAEPRIDEYLCAQPEIEKLSSGCYRAIGLEITVDPLPEKDFGSLKFPRTRTVFKGEDSAVEELHRKFFMNFLSGGA